MSVYVIIKFRLLTLTLFILYAVLSSYLLAQALHLLCVESYVLISPFNYSNYQSILFCVESVIKFCIAAIGLTAIRYSIYLH